MLLLAAVPPPSVNSYPYSGEASYTAPATAAMVSSGSSSSGYDAEAADRYEALAGEAADDTVVDYEDAPAAFDMRSHMTGGAL